MDASTEPRKLRVIPLNADLPPLRIHHLLIWMTVTAVLISGCMLFDRTARNGPPIESRIVIGSLMLGAIAIAGALTFAGVGINWRKQIYPFPKGPGEWLLWSMACGAVAIVAAILGICMAFPFRLLFLYYPITGIVLFVLWVRAVARGIAFHADTIAWRCVFWSLGLLTPFAFIVPITLPMVIFLGCLAWAGGDDLRSRVARGWLHWLGVFLSAALACAVIGAFDAPRFFR